MRRTWSLLLTGCALEAPLLRLSLGQEEEVRAREGETAILPARVEAKGLRARLFVEWWRRGQGRDGPGAHKPLSLPTVGHLAF